MILATYPSSSSNKIYNVIQGGDGVIYCDCPGWKFSRNCKHLKMYNNSLSASATTIPTPVKRVSIAKSQGQIPNKLDEVTANVIRILKGEK